MRWKLAAKAAVIAAAAFGLLVYGGAPGIVRR